MLHKPASGQALPSQQRPDQTLQPYSEASMRILTATIFATLAVLFTFVARADTKARLTGNSEPDIWMMSSPPALSVKVDPAYHLIDITLLKDQDQLPTSIGVTLFDANGGSTVLELKALETVETDPTRVTYSGVLSPAAQSVIGFEIRIPFGTGSATILRSEDMKKQE